MSSRYCVLAGCTDPRINEYAAERNRQAKLLTWADYVIPLNRPGIVRFFLELDAAGPRARELHTGVTSWMHDFRIHWEAHRPAAVILAAHWGCKAHSVSSDIGRKHVQIAAENLRARLKQDDFGGVEVIPCFEQLNSDGSWSLQKAEDICVLAAD